MTHFQFCPPKMMDTVTTTRRMGVSQTLNQNNIEGLADETRVRGGGGGGGGEKRAYRGALPKLIGT